MLDKSVPYEEFWMERRERIELPERSLPAGYQLSFYQEGDEEAWSRIETSVGEFASEAEATAYFQRTFAPYPSDLARRMLFISDENGQKVATCTAWWSKTNGPLFHWLAVMPTAQGHGLATILSIEVTRLLEVLYPEEPSRLHTQTWSHVAVGMYQRLGYQIVPEANYQKVLEILGKSS